MKSISLLRWQDTSTISIGRSLLPYLESVDEASNISTTFKIASATRKTLAYGGKDVIIRGKQNRIQELISNSFQNFDLKIMIMYPGDHMLLENIMLKKYFIPKSTPASTIEFKDQGSTAQAIPAIEVLSEKIDIPRSTPAKINNSQTVKMSNEIILLREGRGLWTLRTSKLCSVVPSLRVSASIHAKIHYRRNQ
ncbi:hypothetical protein BofuT4_P113620.1 [Botrytis cinerea T4]|uniref:Uncharacterized protein n=1 Tax=Botryotinia fuckeliana (strain T4) TaxID=999810 RepID=G2Y5B8_BOTF4|nr:hypothetical protein BofuT4_P113620.1 [Botrytis cinerea T4]